MSKKETITLELTRTEADALMVMLDSEMDTWGYNGGVDFDNWECFDLDAYKLLAFRKFKIWHMEKCNG